MNNRDFGESNPIKVTFPTLIFQKSSYMNKERTLSGERGVWAPYLGILTIKPFPLPTKLYFYEDSDGACVGIKVGYKNIGDETLATALDPTTLTSPTTTVTLNSGELFTSVSTAVDSGDPANTHLAIRFKVIVVGTSGS